jgi:iron uptake system component EfeO
MPDPSAAAFPDGRPARSARPLRLPRRLRSSRTSRAAALAGVSALVVTLTAGCGSGTVVNGQAAVAGAPKVTVGFTDEGCTPSPATVPAGPTNFEMRNAGASAVTEAEVMQGDRILGEKENLTPGLSGTFSLRLAEGTYTVYCPNARTERSTLTVTAAATPAPSNSAHAELAEAVRTYRSYVEAESARLLPATRTFAAAVKAGDVAEAKRLFPLARTHYETIEPVAESFGDLDPEIDARVNDVAAGTTWTGFHRIEKALWQDGTTKGMKPYADKLVKDVTRLRVLVRTVDLQGAQIANGAVDLLGEVANSKITGEEDRYSHTDLADFEANVAGVRAAVAALTPAMTKVDPALQARIRTQLAAVKGSLEQFRTKHGFVPYTEANVPPAKRRELTSKVNTLAETLSKVAPAVA